VRPPPGDRDVLLPEIHLYSPEFAVVERLPPRQRQGDALLRLRQNRRDTHRDPPRRVVENVTGLLGHVHQCPDADARPRTHACPQARREHQGHGFFAVATFRACPAQIPRPSPAPDISPASAPFRRRWDDFSIRAIWSKGTAVMTPSASNTIEPSPDCAAMAQARSDPGPSYS
jgi:hypothetical protein